MSAADRPAPDPNPVPRGDAREPSAVSPVSSAEGTHAATPEGTDSPTAGVVVRRDRYTIEVEGYAIRADESQEQRIRAMDAAARARFLTVMGRTTPPGVSP